MLDKVFVLTLCVGAATSAGGSDIDSDRDGLSDFQEQHKYFTDHEMADSDGDGVQDGDWHERREYAYSIRSVVKVMRPCDPAVANDDYQDARVLSETDAYVELEVVHYPLNTNADSIASTRDWHTPAPELAGDLKAGVTTNWDDAMRLDLLAALKGDGIDVEILTDRETVERVSRWLLARGKYRYMFGTYFVHFPNGEAEIFPGLEEAFRKERGNTDLPFDEHLQHEVFGRGMYFNKCYGTCTSTAVYLTTALRAVGIPTRMILAIPPADSSDSQQMRMIEDHISHHHVRQALLKGVPSGGFASHTFNEVYVGGRWRRLNYGKLGQNNYGPGAMGMLTHVHTFRDLDGAGLTQTWGWRYGSGERDDTFGGSNPYRTMEISDRFGVHSQLENTPIDAPKVAPGSKVAVVSKAYWFFSAERPDSIPAKSIIPESDGHLLMHVDLTSAELKPVYLKMDKEFVLVADGRPIVRARAERGYWNSECYLRIPADQFKTMTPGIPYQLAPADPDAEYGWRVDGDVTIVRD